jgi:hypothetical protein
MRTLTRSALVLHCSLLCISAACQRPAQPEGPTHSQISEDALRDAWDAALSVLRRYDFLPDRQDRAQGVITTLPKTSRQWGEFWRQDTADGYSLAESSLHTTQRKVTIRFLREPTWQVQVQVDVYRLSVPESQITTASAAFQAFSGVLPTTEGTQQIQGAARRQWVHLGRDEAMENRLLDSILRRVPA